MRRKKSCSSCSSFVIINYILRIFLYYKMKFIKFKRDEHLNILFLMIHFLFYNHYRHHRRLCYYTIAKNHILILQILILCTRILCTLSKFSNIIFRYRKHHVKRGREKERQRWGVSLSFLANPTSWFLKINHEDTESIEISPRCEFCFGQLRYARRNFTMALWKPAGNYGHPHSHRRVTRVAEMSRSEHARTHAHICAHTRRIDGRWGTRSGRLYRTCVLAQNRGKSAVSFRAIVSHRWPRDIITVVIDGNTERDNRDKRQSPFSNNVSAQSRYRSYLISERLACATSRSRQCGCILPTAS